jgi:diguanylate cyclase (GGDEF)-like protein/PAS domain S-box-containing protein
MIDLHILFVATPAGDKRSVLAALRNNGYVPHAKQVSHPSALESALLQKKWDVLFVTPVSQEFSIEQTIAALRRHQLDIPCIVLLTDDIRLTLSDAMRLGAHDCLGHVDRQRLVPTVERELVAATLRYNVREQVVTDHLLQEIDQYILHKYDLQAVVSLVCQRLVELFNFRLVWIGMKEPGGVIDMAASAGASDYLDGLEVRWDDTPLGRGTTGTAIRENRPVVLHTQSPQLDPWRKRAELHGMRSILAIPLGIQGDVIGALMMCSESDNTFDKLTVSRLSAFAARVTVAMLGAHEQQQLRLMEAAMSNAANAMFITDCDGKVQWMNEALSRYSGYTAEEIMEHDPTLFNSGKHDAAFWKEMWDTLRAGKPWRGDIINRNKSGELFTVMQIVSPLFNDKGNLTHFLAVQQDISEKRRLEEEIHYLAYHDTLTDLPNRMLFQDRVQLEISQAKRGKSQFAILFIDLDGFKEVNDTLGHSTGDKLLQIVAARLRSSVREGDTVARLGGDEFTIMLRNIAPGEGMERVLGKIIKSVSQPCEFGKHDANVTASIGISLYPSDAADVEKMLIHADEAMYLAKQMGKNRYVFYDQQQVVGG